MKYRKGFVSNSSSSCFILDMRKPLVKELARICKAAIRDAEGVNRCSGIAVGEMAENYAKGWCDTVTWWGEDHRGLGHWILEWYEKLGENLVFIRESDEGMGGYLPVKLRVLEALAEDEMEYH